jgi:hypothetical protein
MLITNKVRSISWKEVRDEMFNSDIKEAETMLVLK